jgi:DNA primase
VVSQAKSILQFYFETTFEKFDSKTPEGKREISKVLLPVVKAVPNKIEKAYWTKELAKKLGVKEETIEEAMKDVKIIKQEHATAENAKPMLSPKKSRKEALEERIVSLILKDPENLELLAEKIELNFTPKLQEIVVSLKSGQQPVDVKLASYLSFSAEAEDGLDCRQEIELCLKEFEALEIRDKMNQLASQLKEAEADKNKEQINSLVEEIRQLTNKLIN